MGVPRIEIAKLKPRSARLNGSVIGEEHARQIGEQLAESIRGDELLVLDFAGVESASASYLKRLLNPFLMDAVNDECARLPAPVVVNAGAKDLREDLADYLDGKTKVLVEAEENAGGFRYAGLIGRLDGAASETFEELRRLKSVTAQKLFELHRDRTTNQTAWNNRLAQLVELRLARRRREGRFWIYQPTVTT